MAKLCALCDNPVGMLGGYGPGGHYCKPCCKKSPEEIPKLVEAAAPRRVREWVQELSGGEPPLAVGLAKWEKLGSGFGLSALDEIFTKVMAMATLGLLGHILTSGGSSTPDLEKLGIIVVGKDGTVSIGSLGEGHGFHPNTVVHRSRKLDGISRTAPDDVKVRHDHRSDLLYLARRRHVTIRAQFPPCFVADNETGSARIEAAILSSGGARLEETSRPPSIGLGLGN
jgi:hypothetical protein